LIRLHAEAAGDAGLRLAGMQECKENPSILVKLTPQVRRGETFDRRPKVSQPKASKRYTAHSNGIRQSAPESSQTAQRLSGIVNTIPSLEILRRAPVSAYRSVSS
jgi:hypothetical protein